MTASKDLYYGDPDRRPATPAFAPKAIPAELRRAARWVGWRFAWKAEEGRWTKVPLDPHKNYTRAAKTNDPKTWAAFPAAHNAIKAAFRAGTAADGLGFVFAKGDGYFGLDIDGCRNPDTKELTPLAARLAAAFATYAEVSPSGLGVKLFGRGEFPAGWSARTGRRNKVIVPTGEELEVYGTGRYFTATGQRLDAAPAGVTDCGPALAAFLAEFFPETKAPPPAAGPARPGLTDEEIIDRIARDHAGLWAGDTGGHGGDDSAADLALANHIAYWCGGPDPDRIDLIFRRSGLYRDKWDRADYRSRTIGAALEGRTKYYDPARTGAAGGAVPPAPGTAADPPAGFALTDYGNAQRLAHRHGKDLRHAEDMGVWYVWDGCRWRPRKPGPVVQMAKQTVRAIPDELVGVKDSDRRRKVLSHAAASESGRGIREMVRLAESEPGVPIEPGDLDADPFLLNCRNGTVDLRTGELRPRRREDLLTKMCPVAFDPDSPCPEWERFLARVFARDPADPGDPGDPDIVAFVRRLFGYAVTGDVTEQILPICWGGGSNGKSTLLNVVREVMGKGYAAKAPRGLLMARQTESHPTEMTVLFGTRLVIATESRRGQRLNEELVKDLTGCEAIKARYMRQDFFEFEPTHKLVLCTNHRPRIPESDDGIWRRVILVPFRARFWNEAKGETGPGHLKRDNGLMARLRGEYPGILAWLVRGCTEWRRDGLRAPAAVQDETAAYRRDEDLIAQYLGERCLVSNAAGNTPLKDVYADYCGWCEEAGNRPLSRNNFSADLRAANVVVKNGSGNKVMCFGVRVIGSQSPVSKLDDFDDE